MLPDLPLTFSAGTPIRTYTPWRYRRSIRTIVKTDSLAGYFRRVLEKGFFVATVYGPPGIGKSESMIELARQICPDFNLHEDVVFTLEDFYRVMEESGTKKWGIKILDDFGSELDPSDGMFDPAKHMSHFMQTARTFYTGYIITTPNKKYINKNTRDRIADYYIELKKRNDLLQCVQGVVHWVQQNNRLEKQYHHCLCLGNSGLYNNKGVGTKVWEWTFNPPSKAFHELYTPLREAKGQRNLDRGMADFRQIEGKSKPIDEIVNEVWENIDEYIKPTKAGRVIIKKAKIETDHSIGGRKSQQVVVKLEERIAKQKTEQIKEEPNAKLEERIAKQKEQNARDTITDNERIRKGWEEEQV